MDGEALCHEVQYMTVFKYHTMKHRVHLKHLYYIQQAVS